MSSMVVDLLYQFDNSVAISCCCLLLDVVVRAVIVIELMVIFYQVDVNQGRRWLYLPLDPQGLNTDNIMGKVLNL